MNAHYVPLADMPTVAPGWPNVYSNREVSTDTIIRFSSEHTASASHDQQIGDGKIATEIGNVQ